MRFPVLQDQNHGSGRDQATRRWMRRSAVDPADWPEGTVFASDEGAQASVHAERVPITVSPTVDHHWASRYEHAIFAPYPKMDLTAFLVGFAKEMGMDLPRQPNGPHQAGRDGPLPEWGVGYSCEVNSSLIQFFFTSKTRGNKLVVPSLRNLLTITPSKWPISASSPRITM